jgi:photosystem II stability/assembly factor-like uncharacterized protein
MVMPAFVGTAHAHGEAPRVVAIEHPAALSKATALLITDTQGLFTLGTAPAPARWLCEDAVGPSAGLNGALVGPEPGTWLVSGSTGLLRSTDAGCSFAPVVGLPAEAVPVGLTAHPERPVERAVGASAAAVGLFFSEDAGATWHPADAPGATSIRSLVRMSAAPDRLYAAGPEGLFRSEDGGRRYVRVAAGGALAGVDPASAYALAGGGRPGAPDEVWVAVQRVPDTLLLRSRDRGETFERVHTLPDPIESLAFDAVGARAVVATLFGTLSRSGPGLTAFVDGPVPAPGFGCLGRDPTDAGDVLWACADAFQGAPFTVATSRDFGETWTPVLTALSAVERRFDCPADTPAVLACADVCPGRPVGATCDPGMDAGMWPDARADAPDASAADASDRPSRDTGSAADAAVVGPTAGATIREGTCAATGHKPAAPGLLVLLLLGWSRARRSTRARPTNTLFSTTDRTLP